MWLNEIGRKRGITQIGGNPKRLLRKRGVDYDGAGFKPEVPDYLGYVLGLMLIWLGYTGYSSVVGMIHSPDSTISKIVVHTKDFKKSAIEKGVEAKRKVTEVVEAQVAASENSQSADATQEGRARLSGHVTYDAEQGWFWSQLDFLNEIIGSVSVSASEYLKGWYAESDLEQSGLIGQESQVEPVEENNTIEYF